MQFPSLCRKWVRRPVKDNTFNLPLKQPFEVSLNEEGNTATTCLASTCLQRLHRLASSHHLSSPVPSVLSRPLQFRRLLFEGWVRDCSCKDLQRNAVAQDLSEPESIFSILQDAPPSSRRTLKEFSQAAAHCAYHALFTNIVAKVSLQVRSVMPRKPREANRISRGLTSRVTILLSCGIAASCVCSILAITRKFQEGKRRGIPEWQATAWRYRSCVRARR